MFTKLVKVVQVQWLWNLPLFLKVVGSSLDVFQALSDQLFASTVTETSF